MFNQQKQLIVFADVAFEDDEHIHGFCDIIEWFAWHVYWEQFKLTIRVELSFDAQNMFLYKGLIEKLCATVYSASVPR